MAEITFCNGFNESPGLMSEHDQQAAEPDPTLSEYVARVDRMLEDRATLMPAVAAFAEELPESSYRRKLQALVAKLEEGTTAEALCRSRDTAATLLPLVARPTFPLRAGGRLHELFVEAARESELRRERLRVMLYPSVVLILALAVLVFLSIVVVPVFDDIFSSFGLELPGFTQVLLQISNSIRSSPILIPVTFLAFCVAVTLVGRLLWRRWTPRLGAWGSGGLKNLIDTAGFTQRLSEGLAAGLSLPATLRIAGEFDDREWIRIAAQRLADDAAAGNHPLTESPARWAFPATVVYVIAQLDPLPAERQPAGELLPEDAAEPGELQTNSSAAVATVIALLDALADAYRERVRQRFDRSSGLVAPFAMISVGLVVGCVLLALLLPLARLFGGLIG